MDIDDTHTYSHSNISDIMIVCLSPEMSSENIYLCINTLQAQNAFSSKLTFIFSGFVGALEENVVILQCESGKRLKTKVKRQRLAVTKQIRSKAVVKPL